jgi:hypothetical protein
MSVMIPANEWRATIDPSLSDRLPPWFDGCAGLSCRVRNPAAGRSQSFSICNKDLATQGEIA